MTTIADVAARAGVSKATASRALSGGGYVADDTRRRVRAVAIELSYVAHSSAMSLATGRSLSVGVIMPSLHRWYFAELLSGIQEGLLASGHDLVLYGVQEESAERAKLFEEVLPGRRLDGIIGVGIQPLAAELERLLLVGSPLVCVGGYSQGVSAISIDDAGAARIATEHLIDLGHHDIAFLGGREDAATHAFGDGLRLTGYRAAMTTAGLAAHIRHAHGSPTVPGGYEAGVRILGDRQNRPTAFVAVCDEVAIGAVVAARRLGLSVPAELSVVGIDDHEQAEMFTLTTVRQQPRAQGLAAVQLLMTRMAAPDAEPARQELPSELVMRASTAVPRV